MLYQFEFTGRKPSKAQLLAKLKAALSEGATMTQLSWGENEIEVLRIAGTLYGHGWIKEISGHDIVAGLGGAA